MTTGPMEQILDTGAHTIRPNEAVEYIGFLGAGGFGEIHCVRSRNGRIANVKLRNRSTRQVMMRSQHNTDYECFARKLLRAIVGNVTEKDIENEKRAIEKLCDTPHDNIIKILEHGRFSNQSPFYFIDMELCAINLEEYIRGSKTGIRGLVDWEIALKEGQHEFLIIAIMQQLLSGLAFIHDRGEVHRDLTPQNGMSRIRLIDNHSPLLVRFQVVEDCGFWIDGERNIPTPPYDAWSARKAMLQSPRARSRYWEWWCLQPQSGYLGSWMHSI